MAKNIIEDYLVSIGCVVNQKEFTQANKKLSGIADLLKKLFGIITSGAAAAVGAMVGLTAAIGPAGRALGNITMGVDKLALNLHTTTKNARSLQTVMQAMGIDSLEDLKYINLIPEQRRQFMELRKVAAENAPSMQAKSGLDELKKLGFEFQKFEVKLTSLGTEFLGQLGIITKEPLFKKVPQLLEVLLDLIKLIANTVLMIAKKLGSYKNFQDLNHRGFRDLGRSAAKQLGLPTKSDDQLKKELRNPKKKLNIDPLDPGSFWYGGDKKPKWKTRDSGSPAIKAFLKDFRTKEDFSVTSALPDHKGGHARRSNHYTGHALDIGVGGKSTQSIASLVASALKVQNTKRVNLELVDGKNRADRQAYNAVISILSKMGFDTSKVTNFVTPQTTGSHAHIDLADPVKRLAEKAKPPTYRPSTNSNTHEVPDAGPQKGDEQKVANVTVNLNITGIPNDRIAEEIQNRLIPIMRNRDSFGFA